jgi:hypothetical protein
VAFRPGDALRVVFEQRIPTEYFAFFQYEAGWRGALIAPDLKFHAARLQHHQFIRGVAVPVYPTAGLKFLAARKRGQRCQRSRGHAGKQLAHVQRALRTDEQRTVLDHHVVAFQRRFGQSHRRAGADVPLPQVLRAGQHRAIVKTVAQVDFLVRADRLHREILGAGIRHQHLQPALGLEFLHAIGGNVFHHANALFAHSRLN